ncbi:hypothetical protein EYF80_005698 [Liparis tanakae]|uniref:Uncharacterized protein n=1 Tax=Liparis tanakae TaxID=230148 RepID=A0A4Z2J3R0_9TELE|nr:hypothetical protein EYF80_005698 [Liparis tanakae]
MRWKRREQQRSWPQRYDHETRSLKNPQTSANAQPKVKKGNRRRVRTEEDRPQRQPVLLKFSQWVVRSATGLQNGVAHIARSLIE